MSSEGNNTGGNANNGDAASEGAAIANDATTGTAPIVTDTTIADPLAGAAGADTTLEPGAGGSAVAGATGSETAPLAGTVDAPAAAAAAGAAVAEGATATEAAGASASTTVLGLSVNQIVTLVTTLGAGIAGAVAPGLTVAGFTIGQLANLAVGVANEIPEAVQAFEDIKAVATSGLPPTTEQWAAWNAAADAAHDSLQAAAAAVQ